MACRPRRSRQFRGTAANEPTRQVQVFRAVDTALSKPKMTPEQLRLATGDSSILERLQDVKQA